MAPGEPGNFTLKTFSSLLAGRGYKPTFGARPLNSLPRTNFDHPLTYDQEKLQIQFWELWRIFMH